MLSWTNIQAIAQGPSTLELVLLECCSVQDLTDWNLSNLCDPFWRFYWNPTPGNSVLFQGRRIPLAPDRVVVIAPLTDWRAQSLNPVDHFFVHFQLRGPVTGVMPGVHAFDLAPSHRRYIREIIDKGMDRGALQMSLEHRLASLLYHYIGLLPSGMIRTRGSDDAVGRVCEYIDKNLGENLSNGDLAAISAQSLRSFLLHFKEHTGSSPGQYILRRRIEHAAMLLKYSDQSVKEIAESVGFCDRSHFSVMFRRVMGASPAAFRKTRLIVGQ